MRVLSAADVAAAFDPATAIASQRRAFTELGLGHAQLAPKVHVDGADESVALTYTARIAPEAAAVAKFVSVNPANAARGLATIHGLVLVLDAQTGTPAAVMTGTAVTTLRTAAASAVAIDALAPAQARRVVIVGSGVQAGAHARMLPYVRTCESITLVVREPEQAAELVEALRSELMGPEAPTSSFAGPVGDIRVAADERETQAALRGADIVVTTTTSLTPVVALGDLAPGATVVSIGSFTPARREIAAADLRTAGLVVVDDLPTAQEHSGPIMDALAQGVLTTDEVVPLGSILAGTHVGRVHADQPVVFLSVGIGVQDAAAAEAILARADEQGLGTTVDL